MGKAPTNTHKPPKGQGKARSAEAREAAALALARGATEKDAAKEAGISPDTLSEWRRQPEFMARVKELRAKATTSALDELVDATLVSVRWLRSSVENEEHTPELRSLNAQRILDRAGLGPSSTHKVETTDESPEQLEARARAIMEARDAKRRREQQGG